MKIIIFIITVIVCKANIITDMYLNPRSEALGSIDTTACIRFLKNRKIKEDYTYLGLGTSSSSSINLNREYTMDQTIVFHGGGNHKGYNLQAIGFTNLSVDKLISYENNMFENYKIMISNPILYTSILVNLKFNKFNFYFCYNTSWVFENINSLLSFGLEIKYKFYIGNISLALRDLKYYSSGTSFEDNRLINYKYINHKNDITEYGLIDESFYRKNLVLGWDKTFIIRNSKLNTIIVLDNLLCNSLYTDSRNPDYSISRKIHLGFEFEKSLNNKIYFLRVGLKNLLPTVGIGLQINNFNVDLAFSNISIDVDEKEKKNMLFLASLEYRFEKVIYS